MSELRPQGTEARVCEDIAERQALGIAKYGTTVADNPLCLLEWMEHAYQECLDQAVYLKRAMEELDKIVTKPVEPAPSTPEPQPFKAGDWVVCVRGHLHPDVDLIEGQLYRITDASGWIYLDAKGQTRGGWHRDRFRHATAAEIAAAQPQPLQLAEGKYYERRDGEIVGPCKQHDLAHDGFQWKVGKSTHRNNGRHCMMDDCPMDLIREVQPPGQCKVCSDGTCDGCESGREWQPELVAQLEAKREAEADGWIANDGFAGGPVAGDIRVDVKYRSGSITRMYARNAYWDIQEKEDDIVAYRVVPPEPPAPKQYRPFASADAVREWIQLLTCGDRFDHAMAIKQMRDYANEPCGIEVTE